MIYIIKRNDWFYFSKRIEGKLFRMALRTKRRLVANNIVQIVIDKIEGSRVSIKVLKLIIEEEINRVIDRTTALISILVSTSHLTVFITIIYNNHLSTAVLKSNLF